MRTNKLFELFSKTPFVASSCLAFLVISLVSAPARAQGVAGVPVAEARLSITDNGQAFASQPVTVVAPGAGLVATRKTDANGQIRAALPMSSMPNSPLALAYPDGQRQRINLPKDGSALLVASDRQGGILALSPNEAARLAESARPLRVGINGDVGSGARASQKMTETLGGLLGGLLGGRGGGSGFGAPSGGDAGKPDLMTDPVPATAKRRFVDSASGSEIELGTQMTPNGLLVSAALTKSADDGTFQTIYLQDAQGRRAGPVEYFIYSLYEDWTLTVSWTYDRWVNNQHVEHRQGGWSESGSNMLGSFMVPAEGDGIWRQLGFSNGVRGIKTLGMLFPVSAERMTQQPMHLVVHVTRPSLEPVVTTPFVISLVANVAPVSNPLILLNSTPLLEGLPPGANAPASDGSGKVPAGTPQSAPQSAPPAAETPQKAPPPTAGGSATGNPPPKSAPGTTERENLPDGGNKIATATGNNDAPASTPPPTPPGGVCGPDITERVLDVLDRMAADFSAAPQATRQQACDALFAFSTFQGAWDISPLDPSMAIQPDSTPMQQSRPAYWFEQWGVPSGCSLPRVPCGWTAQFMGQCIHAQQINYVQWGAMNKLCGTEDKGRLAVVLRGNVRTPQEIVQMQLLMSEMGAMYTQRSIIPALFDGASVPMEAAQRTVDPAANRDRGNFFSLGQTAIGLAIWAIKAPESGCATTCSLIEPQKTRFAEKQFNYHWEVLHQNRPGAEKDKPRGKK
jgi:hypothetical protein